MQVPVQVSFDDIPASDKVRSQVEAAAVALEQFHDHITSCRVALSAPDQRHRAGVLFDIRISVRMPPRREIVVSRKTHDHPEREHLDVALRESFALVRRQVQDAVRNLRGDVKVHVEPDHGKVAKLFGVDGYGFIETPDGQEIYFHRNSVVNGGFDKLTIGQEVRFVEAMGDKGPQASTVKALGKNNGH